MWMAKYPIKKRQLKRLMEKQTDVYYVLYDGEIGIGQIRSYSISHYYYFKDCIRPTGHDVHQVLNKDGLSVSIDVHIWNKERREIDCVYVVALNQVSFTNYFVDIDKGILTIPVNNNKNGT